MLVRPVIGLEAHGKLTVLSAEANLGPDAPSALRLVLKLEHGSFTTPAGRREPSGPSTHTWQLSKGAEQQDPCEWLLGTPTPPRDKVLRAYVVNATGGPDAGLEEEESAELPTRPTALVDANRAIGYFHVPLACLEDERGVQTLTSTQFTQPRTRGAGLPSRPGSAKHVLSLQVSWEPCSAFLASSTRFTKQTQDLCALLDQLVADVAPADACALRPSSPSCRASPTRSVVEEAPKSPRLGFTVSRRTPREPAFRLELGPGSAMPGRGGPKKARSRPTTPRGGAPRPPARPPPESETPQPTPEETTPRLSEVDRFMREKAHLHQGLALEKRLKSWLPERPSGRKDLAATLLSR